MEIITNPTSATRLTTTYFRPDNSGVTVNDKLLILPESSVIQEANRWVSGIREVYQFETDL